MNDLLLEVKGEDFIDKHLDKDSNFIKYQQTKIQLGFVSKINEDLKKRINKMEKNKNDEKIENKQQLENEINLLKNDFENQKKNEISKLRLFFFFYYSLIY